MDLEKLKLHFVYIVSILVFVLIVVATGFWTDKENFTEFLANAATMISVVLGLVAIFYSFISNASLSKSLGNIMLVSDGIQKSNSQVNQFISQAEQLNRANSTNVERMHNASENINDNLTSLNATLLDLNQKSITLQEIVTGIPNRLDMLENKVLESTKDLKATNTQSNTPLENLWNEKQMKRYFDRSGLGSNLIMYACQLAFKSKKPLDLNVVSTLLPSSTPTFLSGFLNASFALGLINRKLTSARVYEINELDSQLNQFNVLAYLNNFFEKSKQYSKVEKENWLESAEKIRKYFE